MQESVDQPFDGHFLLERPRKRINRIIDPYAVEPWEKTTIQISNKQIPEIKKYQTFYQSPTFRHIGNRRDRHYLTQRVFSFNKQQDYSNKAQKNQKEHVKLTITSHKSAVSQYNINGSFITQIVSPKIHKTGNKFFMRCPKDKKTKQKQRQTDVTVPVQSIQSIKRRINFSKEISNIEDSKFIRLNSENDQRQIRMPAQNKNVWKERKKNKVISLGFQKFSALRETVKQKKINLSFLVL